MAVLPLLSPNEHLDHHTREFIQQLKSSVYRGDIEVSYASRMAVATDNSVYQQLPQAVLHPKSIEDLVAISELAAQNPSVSFSARGGGTGTNGQSLTPGIVVDTSRHMRKIIEINTQEGWVRVQAGVVKDALNDALRPYGYFFSPDLSTSNRATIGGMISTDASGQGSLVYGKTSDHLLSVTAVLADGTLLSSEKVAVEEAKVYAQQATSLGRIYKQVIETCVEKRAIILQKFPRLNRFLTGYDLEHAYDDSQQTIDLGRLIAGAEGSLGFIAEAKLSITAIPQHTVLVNIKYNNFESALRHAPSMIEAQATSVETVDSLVLNLARQDIIWHQVSDLIKEVEGKTIDGLNMVEYNSESKVEIEDKLNALKAMLDAQIVAETAGVIDYQIIDNKADIQKIYAMRKKSVGLLGNAKGEQKPIAFAEDTAVPPEHLADYIMEFRALLDSHGLRYGMFGHVDAGVLHVRPALNLCDPEQERLMKAISDQVVKLVSKYGGLMWGEHGKGYRSEYSPEFFGEELYQELCKIKAAFDPHNQMNPGKICVPFDSAHQLVKVSDTKRATFDRQIPIEFRESFKPAMSCNGNGLCFNYDQTSPMCPSSKITRDRRHSPKGRAGLIREWLFQLQKHGVDAKRMSPNEFKSAWFKSSANKNDFSYEVFDAMNGCLACKSCTNQCPINVDVPDFRAKFLAIYYSKYRRPIKDLFVANVERMAPFLAKFPKLTNAIISSRLTSKFMRSFVGYVDVPLLSTPTLASQTPRLACEFDLESLKQLTPDERQNYVLIVQDPFTSFYDAEIVIHTIGLLSKMGKKPVLLPFKPNGKPQHVKGFLKAFEKTVRQTDTFLAHVASTGIPMIGVDASLVLCYRDEYRKVLAKADYRYEVLTLTEYLANQSFDKQLIQQTNYKLFTHCTEKTALPKTEAIWQKIFESLGLKLSIEAVGCCGMAGTYGHELEHLDNSVGIYDLSWRSKISQQENETILVTGYSCRSQVKRLEGFRPKHPIEVLNSLL